MHDSKQGKLDSVRLGCVCGHTCSLQKCLTECLGSSCLGKTGPPSRPLRASNPCCFHAACCSISLTCSKVCRWASSPCQWYAAAAWRGQSHLATPAQVRRSRLPHWCTIHRAQLQDRDIGQGPLVCHTPSLIFPGTMCTHARGMLVSLR